MPLSSASGRENEDINLVAAAVGGSESAFRQIINQNKNLVISIVYRMITRKEDREDLCQDVFLNVYAKLPEFRFNAKLSTWIATIAFNSCINFLRKRKAVLLEDLLIPGKEEEGTTEQWAEMTEDHNATPERTLELKERGDLLQKEIEQLSVIQRTILQLFHQNDLSLQEICIITDLSLSAVKTHLFRARKKLKDKLGNY